jgi:aspartyl-tRNA(Asn)/glutamyl-tRNA(Gln) amidotransferase subunit A
MPVPPEHAFADLVRLGRALRAGEYTCVELCEFFLQRLQVHGPRLNAVVTILREPALEEARRRDAELRAGRDRGPLHGIPYGAKDLLATAAIPTTWGAAPLRGQIFERDATVIRRLREAGAVLAAKLAMVEIAGGLGYDQANASFTGPGLNPWDLASWSGGSSSGSGSAVGAGLVPFAIGSETWGSIITPAGYCGISGLRPTYGRVSRHGAMALSWSLDKLGPMCRTAADCGLVLAAIAGPDPEDPTAVDRPFVWPPESEPRHEAENAETPRRFRLAVLKGAAVQTQPEVRANFEQSLQVLAQHADLVEVDQPRLPAGIANATIIACEMAAAFESLVRSGDIWEMTAPEDRIGVHAALFIPAKDYINAQRVRRRAQRVMDELLAPFDALAAPALATVAPPIAVPFAEYQRGFGTGGLSALENAAGLPGLTVPNGFGERGLPTGLLLVGRAFGEQGVLEVAEYYQGQTDWHQRVPPAFQ